MGIYNSRSQIDIETDQSNRQYVDFDNPILGHFIYNKVTKKSLFPFSEAYFLFWKTYSPKNETKHQHFQIKIAQTILLFGFLFEILRLINKVRPEDTFFSK